MSGRDQRRDPRVDTRQSVWVEGQDSRIEAQARNMSKTGMFVVAESGAPAIGTTLEIKFEDPKEGQIALKMEVVWRDEQTENSKLGLRALDSEGMAAFERVVSRYLGEGEEKKDDEGNTSGGDK
ncbi:MAG: PilZ domain-containing protein [Myxococcales bacterium]